MNIIIRKAAETDFAAIYSLIKEFAVFQKTPQKVSITVEEMKAQKDLFECFVAVNDKEEIIGFASCFFAYYSWSGKAFYLDDLYVTEFYRGYKTGTRLLETVIDFAKKSGCIKVRWQVSNWNKNAIAFYKKMGAIIDDVEINCDLDLRSLNAE